MSNNLESIGIVNPPVGDQVFHPAPVPGGANDSGRSSIEGTQWMKLTNAPKRRDLSPALFRSDG
jgi:hypothetical protein